MAQAQESTAQAQDLRQELYGLVRTERELRQEIGRCVITGESVIALRALRSANREAQEDLSAAVILLDAATP